MAAADEATMVEALLRYVRSRAQRGANWTQAGIDTHLNTRQMDFDQVLNLVQQGLITGFLSAASADDTCPA